MRVTASGVNGVRVGGIHGRRWARGTGGIGAAALLALFACEDASPTRPDDTGPAGAPDIHAHDALATARVVRWNAPNPVTAGTEVEAVLDRVVSWDVASLELRTGQGQVVVASVERSEAGAPRFVLPPTLLRDVGVAEASNVTWALRLDGALLAVDAPAPGIARLAPALAASLPAGLGRLGMAWTVGTMDAPRPGEGELALRMAGRLTPEDGSQPARDVDATVALTGTTEARDEATGAWPQWEPGRFAGEAHLVWSTTAGDAGIAGPWPLDVSLVVPSPALPSQATLAPGWVLPILAGVDGEDPTAWLIDAARERGGGEEERAPLACDVEAGVLRCHWPVHPDGSGAGFAGVGDLRDVAPLRVAVGRRAANGSVAWSAPERVSVTYRPAVQFVRVRYTRGFVRSLELAGLAPATGAIAAASLARMNEHLDPARVIFVDEGAEIPAHSSTVTVLDVSGADPNGLGLFGYDNSPGKDVGNRRMGDRIGGTNARTQADGMPGYGGVFVESFLFWSSTPPPPLVRGPASPDPEPEFDAVVGPFLTEPLRASEWNDPASPRRAMAERAAELLSNVIAETAAHEVGHALGLANPHLPASGFHRDGAEEGCLMNAGTDRPFHARAALNGEAPATLCGDERAYLLQILPGTWPP